jgi:hypothetical protein
MLAYVIIAVELLILYTVFWYVFLREPKPYRIQGNAWGVYDGPDPKIKGFAQGFDTQPHGDNCGCQAEKDAKIRSASAIYEEWNAPHTNAPLTAGELIRSQSRGVERVMREMPVSVVRGQQNQGQQSNMPQYAPHNPAEQCRSKYNTLPAFLTELGDKLNLINVKLP